MSGTGSGLDRPEDPAAAEAQPELCCICEDQLATRLGPYSGRPLCPEHLAADLADARRLLADVDDQLRPFRGAGTAAALAEELRVVGQRQAATRQAFEAAKAALEQWRAEADGAVEAQLEALRTCLRDCEDLEMYDAEVAAAGAVGNLAGACDLALSMQLSVADLQREFDAARSLRSDDDASSTDLHGARRLQRVIASLSVGADDSSDAAVTACPGTRQAATWARDPWAAIVKSRRPVPLEDWVMWVAACSDTAGFVGDPTGRIVPAAAAVDDCAPVPQPCLILAMNTCDKKDHLAVISVDGAVTLRSHCLAVNWQEPICGVHCCSGRQLFVAQSDAVTETDLSGRLVRKICPPVAGGSIWGVGGSAWGLYVAGGNEIAELSKATGEVKRMMKLDRIPDAMLSSLVVHDGCILVRDRQHGQVHQVNVGTQQLVATHPTQRAGLAQFEAPRDVAVDSRGRVFVSEFKSDLVRVFDSDDGSLLQTLGSAAEGGLGGEDWLLDSPCGLAVVTGGQCELLVVACSPPTMFGSRRLVVFDLH